jgi:hypothetical protein
MKCIEKQALAVPSVNQFLLQYFVNYNLKKGWYISVLPTITANWEVNTGR